MAGKLPEECSNINDIREEIDSIDNKIIELIGLRYNYVKEIVKYKERTKESIVAKERYNSVLKEKKTYSKKTWP